MLLDFIIWYIQLFIHKIMTKYIVVADTYNLGYGSEFYLFSIFNTKEEAIKWIINNPEHSIPDSYDPDTQISFNFFDNYHVDMKERVFKEINGKYVHVEDRPVTIEMYCEKFIKEFNGTPIYVGGYIE